jgi:hypothetical protein
LTCALVGAPDSPVREPALSGGLSAHGINVCGARSLDDDLVRSADVVVFDGGSDTEGALRATRGVASHGLRLIVALRTLDATSIRDFIEQGASDVVAYPLTPDVVARKLRRFARRRP